MQIFLCTDPNFVHKLPDNMSFEQGAVAEIVSVAFRGVRKASDLTRWQPYMIAGCGPIGLATLLLADVSVAYPIVVSDISEDRLKFAQQLVLSVMTYKNDISLIPKKKCCYN